MNKEKLSTINLILSMIVFGTIGIFRRYIPMPSSSLAMLRGIIGTVFLLAVILLKGKKLSFKAIKHKLLILIVSGAMIGINWVLLFESYNHTTVAIATICYYMAPVFVMIASPIVLKEKLTPLKAGCVIGAVIGMLLVSGIFKAENSNSELIGVLFGVGAAVFYAAVIMLNQKLKEVDAYNKTIVQLFFASAVMVPYVLLTEADPFGEVTSFSIMMVLIVGMIHTGLAYVLYFGSMKYLNAQKVALFGYIDPVVAVLLSAFLIREVPTTLEVLGIVLVLLSTMISEIPIDKKYRKH